MTWFIVFFMANVDPFAVRTLEFETYNECVAYVNNESNASRLAIEVIDRAGFNDEILTIACLPEHDVPEERTQEA